MTIRVLLADDHAHIRATLRRYLERDSQLDVVGEAADGRRAVEMALELEPDVVLMDVNMPVLGGIPAMRLITASRASVDTALASKPIRVIAVSLYSDQQLVNEALAAGARGYLLKNNVVRELIPAIHDVMAGQICLSSKLSTGLSSEPTDGTIAAGVQALSDEERDILRLTAEGRANDQIALTLCMSDVSLEQCRRAIREKLRLQSALGWTRFLHHYRLQASHGANASRAQEIIPTSSSVRSRAESGMLPPSSE